MEEGGAGACGAADARLQNHFDLGVECVALHVGLLLDAERHAADLTFLARLRREGRGAEHAKRQVAVHSLELGEHVVEHARRRCSDSSTTLPCARVPSTAQYRNDTRGVATTGRALMDLMTASICTSVSGEASRGSAPRQELHVAVRRKAFSCETRIVD